MPFTCELSGEIVSGTKEEVVATPSGHVCLKRLLLEKLSENGGVDPFETASSSSGSRPLSVDDLIPLKGPQKEAIVTPRPNVTSMPNLLQLIQSEYDALVLELFDTRKALEETRQELSQALYQNDAAVRVIARLSTERDAARQELQQWQASAQTAPAPTEAEASTVERPPAEDEPEAKRRRTEPEPEGVAQNSLPESDVEAMLESWKNLTAQRKPTIKALVATAPTPEVLANYVKTDSQSWHKTSCKGLNCLAVHGNLMVTGGKDKQVILYAADEKVIKHSWSFKTVPTCIDISDSLVVASDKSGNVAVYSVADGSTLSELSLPDAVSSVSIHPTNQYVCFTTASGKLLVARLKNQTLSLIAEFQGEDKEVQYTCGAVHPDGLLFGAGTQTGHVHLWDFKNKVLASVLKADEEGDTVTTIAFSNNGYHLAVGHQSACARFWDLRKQKTIAKLNEGKASLKSVASVAFDESGKFAVLGGNGGLLVTTVKEWGTTASISTPKEVADLVWTKATGLASCSNKERMVSFYGAKE